MFLPEANVPLPHGRFTASVRFLHEFKLRVPYVVRKAGGDGPLSAAANCSTTGRGVVDPSFLKGFAGVQSAHNTRQDSSVVVTVSLDTPAPSPSAENAALGVDTSAPASNHAQHRPRTPSQHDADAASASPTLSEALLESLRMKALLNAGPVGYATALASECGWLTFDVKVRDENEQQPVAASISYKTRWVRTSLRPTPAVTSALFGPFTATLYVHSGAPRSPIRFVFPFFTLLCYAGGCTMHCRWCQVRV